MANKLSSRDSSVVLFLIATSVAGVILISARIVTNGFLDVSRTWMFYVILVLLGISILGMFLAMCCAKKLENNNIGETSEMYAGFKKLPMVALFIFLLGTVISAVFAIVRETQCLPYTGANYSNIKNMITNSSDVADLSVEAIAAAISFYSAKILFVLLQFAFLLSFRKTRFKYPCMRNFIHIVIAANLALWLDSFIFEYLDVLHHSIQQDTVEDTFKPANDKHGLSSEFVTAEMNKSGLDYDNFVKCIFSNTTFIVEVSDSSMSYLYPFNMELFVIAISMLGHIWVQAGEEYDTADPRQLGEENHIFDGRQSPMQNSVNNVGFVDINRNQELEPLLGTSNPTENDQKRKTTKNTCGICMFTLGIAYVSAYGVVAALIAYKDVYEDMILVHYGLQIGFYLLCTAICLVCRYLLKGTKIEDSVYSAEDALLLAPSFGVFWLHTFFLVASMSMIFQSYSSDDISLNLIWLVTINAFCNVASVVAQTLLLLKITRVKYMPKPTRASKLCNIIPFLILCNLAKWGMDSFIEIKSLSAYPLQKLYFGDAWPIIVIALYPFCIFYRFHCAFLLFDTLPKLQRYRSN